ncbi:unnamed protein product [Amoebophrya sp. A120]|nr:unnamed protein product [Amoebophrya sp. A120]|eukprot:GSA120T00017898001.1
MYDEAMNAASAPEQESQKQSWTGVDEIPGIVRSVRLAVASGISVPERILVIQAIQRWLEEDAAALRQAEWEDLRRPAAYHDLIRGNCVATCRYYLENLERLSCDVDTTPPNPPAPGSRASHAYVRREPKGVVLVIGTWNFPLPLHIKPLVTAIAAGCPVVLKLNEICEQTSLAMQNGLAKFLAGFSSTYVQTVFGGVAQTTKLLQYPFGMIFYTGNATVGKIIYRQAAEHLTPVTLELGGKNPVVLLPGCNLKYAVRKLLDAKLQNVGQFCVSPDHVWLHRTLVPEFRRLVKATLLEFLGENPKASPRYSRIVNQRHFDRILGIVKNGWEYLSGRLEEGTTTFSFVEDLAPAGYDPLSNADAADRYIPPVVLLNLPKEARLRQEEIFGPCLAANVFEELEDIFSFESSNNGEPLALYIFGDTKSEEAEILEIQNRLRSGGVCVNDAIVHMLAETLPFGGTGSSGFGNYRGDWGFNTFTHERAVMVFDKDDLHPRLQEQQDL